MVFIMRASPVKMLKEHKTGFFVFVFFVNLLNISHSNSFTPSLKAANYLSTKGHVY